LLVVRILGPEAFGVAAVVVALGAVATNLVDTRLIDLISNLYYNEHASCPETGVAYRQAALRLGFRLYACSAILIVLVAGAVSLVGVPRLAQTPLPASWLWAAACAQGVAYFGGFFVFIQRFGLPPRRMAALQLVSALVNAAAMIAAVSLNPGVGGFATGLLTSACAIAALNMVVMVSHLRTSGITLFRAQPGSPATIDRSLVRRFLATGNLFGYVKLLHRSADVLLVAVFCSDRETGLYKLARSITDALHAMSEAIGRVYQPRLLVLLQRRDHVQFVRTARFITGLAAGLTGASLIGGIMLLPHVAPMLGVDDVYGLTVCVAIMTLSFFFVAGLHSWILPVFVHAGRTSRCTVWGAVAVLAGQYTVGPALAQLTGHPVAAWFCVGYLTYYLLATLPLWREARATSGVFSLVPQAAGL
jgi:O-antigen/teichoic acid export membrane protein